MYIQEADENAGSQRTSQDCRFGHKCDFEIMTIQYE